MPAIVLTGLGVLGFPLLPVPSRAGDTVTEEHLITYRAAVHSWAAHAGWRFSGSAWLCFAGALALWGLRSFVVAELSVKRPVWRNSLVFGGPAVAVAAICPAIQHLVGLPLDNYSGTPLDGSVYAWCATLMLAWIVATSVRAVRAVPRKRVGRRKVPEAGRGRHS